MAQATRREQRERAMSLLYEADAKDVPVQAVISDLPLAPDDFVVELVAGVEQSRSEVDRVVAAHAIDWSVERMPVIDRVLLRMATFELLERPDVPTGAIISEAVELAKQYSTDESGRFINGVLASVANEARPEPQ